MSETHDLKTLSFDDRMDRITEGRRLSHTPHSYHAELSASLADCMPRLHRDCYWLLGIVESLDPDILDGVREEMQIAQDLLNTPPEIT